LVGFLILTGLPWSEFWGKTFTQVSSQYPAQVWDEVPKSTVLTGSLNQHGEHIVPWAVEQLPMPRSSTSGHTHHAGHTSASSTDSLAGIPSGIASSSQLSAVSFQSNRRRLGKRAYRRCPNRLGYCYTSVNLDSIVALAQAKGAPSGFSVSFPEGKTGVYTVSAFPDNPTQETTLHIDQYSGKILADVRWQDYGLVPKAVEMGIALHMGRYFGFGNQLLMLFGCLVVIALCVSGVVMWWQRRPKQSGWIGAPDLPPYVQQWKVPLAIVAVLGILFPLVGISLVTVLLLDYLVLSRIPVLRHIFR
jgi:uncharacterized iron-regulated membrane protein